MSGPATSEQSVGGLLRTNPKAAAVHSSTGTPRSTTSSMTRPVPRSSASSTASVGEPMFDLAHIWASTWGTRPEEYGGVLGVDLEATGLPTDEEFLTAYYGGSHSADRLLPFHKVFGLFRYAGIFHGIGQRALSGNATATNASQQGRNAHTYLDRALEHMDSL